MLKKLLFISELPPVVMQLKNLQRLYAQFLHLKSLPDNIGDLTELQNLSLSGNCFKTLPDSLKKMTKLANLSLNGVAWMRSRSNSVLSKDHFEEFLKSNNLHRWLERYDQVRVCHKHVEVWQIIQNGKLWEISVSIYSSSLLVFF